MTLRVFVHSLLYGVAAGLLYSAFILAFAACDPTPIPAKCAIDRANAFIVCGGRPMHWPQVPVRVVSDDVVVVEAVHRWNEDAGLELLQTSTAGAVRFAEADASLVTQIRREIGAPRAVAAAFVGGSYDTCLFSDATIYMFDETRDFDEDEQISIVQHELGHVLGLGHDAGPTLMGGERRDRDCRAAPAHVALLQEMYL